MTAHGELPSSIHATLPEPAILTSKRGQERFSAVFSSGRVVGISRNVVLD